MVERDDDEYGPEEAARRRDAIVRRMITTPPQPRPKAAPEFKRGRPRKPKAQ